MTPVKVVSFLISLSMAGLFGRLSYAYLSEVTLADHAGMLDAGIAFGMFLLAAGVAISIGLKMRR